MNPNALECWELRSKLCAHLWEVPRQGCQVVDVSPEDRTLGVPPRLPRPATCLLSSAHVAWTLPFEFTIKIEGMLEGEVGASGEVPDSCAFVCICA